MTSPSDRRPRQWWQVGLTVGVIVAGILAAVRFLDVAAIADHLVRADAGLLVAATVGYALSWPVRGMRYRDILRSMGHSGGTVFLTGAVFLSQGANLIVPARAGDGLRAYLLKDRLDIPYATGVASLLVERILDLLVVTFIGGVAALWLFRPAGDFDATAVDETILIGAAGVGAISVLVVGVFGAFALRSPVGQRWPVALLPESVASWSARCWHATCRAFGDVRTAGAMGATSVAIWVLDVGAGLVVGIALGGLEYGGGVPGFVAAIAVAVSVGNLSKAIPLTHGGIGVYEAAFAGMLVAATPLPAEAAIAVAVLDHGLKNGFTLVGAIGCALALSGRLPRSTDDIEPSRF